MTTATTIRSRPRWAVGALLVTALGLVPGSTDPAQAATLPFAYWHFDRMVTDASGTYVPDSTDQPSKRAYLMAHNAGGKAVIDLKDHPPVASSHGSLFVKNANASSWPYLMMKDLRWPRFGPLTVEYFARIDPNSPVGRAGPTYNVFPVSLQIPQGTQFLYTQLWASTRFSIGTTAQVGDGGNVSTNGGGTYNLDAPPTYVDSAWHHYALVYDEVNGTEQVKAYVDRELVSTVVTGYRVTSPLARLEIGSDNLIPGVDKISELRVTLAALAPDHMLGG